MAHNETVSGLFEYFHNNMYSTVELVKSGDGYVSTWYVSRTLGNNLGVELIGRLVIPVWGAEHEDAVRRLGFISDSVVEFLSGAASGLGEIGNGGDVVSARRHCKAHIQVWIDVIGNVGGEGIKSKTAVTADLYLLAVNFGVNNPAALIAEVEVVGVKAIHDRLNHARRLGLLVSYGKGRIKNEQDSDDRDNERGFKNGKGRRGSKEESSGSGFDIFSKTELGFKRRDVNGVWS
jgi:hypothetical protein